MPTIIVIIMTMPIITILQSRENLCQYKNSYTKKTQVQYKNSYTNNIYKLEVTNSDQTRYKANPNDKAEAILCPLLI